MPPPSTTRPMPSPSIVTGIVDLHHDDPVHDLAAAVADGLTLLWLKETQGVDWNDPACASRAATAHGLGVIVGTYAFGTGLHPGRDQADDYLARQSQLGTPVAVRCLDLESNPRGPTMTTAQACDFVSRVHEVTGVWPVLYAGASNLRARMHLATDVQRAILAKCPLWLAEYQTGDPLAIPAPAPWSAWTLQQYTDGKDSVSPHDHVRYPTRIAGIGGCDRSVFRGTAAELRTAVLSWGVEAAA